MLVQLIQSDNDSGRAATRMGRGPGQILAGGLPDRLRDEGHQVEVIRVTSRAPFPAEIATAFEVASALSRQVRMAARQRRFPILLAGNCMASLGAVAGLPRGRNGLIWMDAHGDLHTPESTRSGFLDGMSVATALGLCWRGMSSAIPGFGRLAAADVLLLGTRDLDEAERLHLREHGIASLVAAVVRGQPDVVDGALRRLTEATDRIHLHIDLDVLDPQAVGPANEFTPAGGLLAHELLRVVQAVKAMGGPASATLSAYDPSVDEENRVRDAAHEVISALVA